MVASRCLPQERSPIGFEQSGVYCDRPTRGEASRGPERQCENAEATQLTVGRAGPGSKVYLETSVGLPQHKVFTERLVVRPAARIPTGREPRVTSLRGGVAAPVFLSIWQKAFQSPQTCQRRGLTEQFPKELGA